MNISVHFPCRGLISNKGEYQPRSNGRFKAEFLSETDLYIVSNRAYELEKIFHGSPSGMDNTISAFGGALTFQSGELKRLSR